MGRKTSFKFEHFQKLWLKSNLDQKSKLFYYSLFDFGSFEQEAGEEILKYTREIEKKLKELIKDIHKKFFNKIEKDGFIKVVANDKLLRFILLHELKEKGIKVSYNPGGFPDLIIDNNIEFEIKRLTTTRNFQEYFSDLNSKKSSKLFILLLFPRISGEDIGRLKELTDGYYFAKTNLKNNSNVDMLILYPDIDNFKDILEKIINCLKFPKWYRNG